MTRKLDYIFDDELSLWKRFKWKFYHMFHGLEYYWPDLELPGSQYMYFYCDKLSFKPSRSDLIYVESQPHPDFTRRLAKHLDEFNEFFQIYEMQLEIPSYDVERANKEIISYNYPWIADSHAMRIAQENPNSSILKALVPGKFCGQVQPGIIRFIGSNRAPLPDLVNFHKHHLKPNGDCFRDDKDPHPSDDDIICHVFEYRPFIKSNKHTIEQQLQYIVRHIVELEILFHWEKAAPDSDFSFDQIEMIKDEIRQRVQTLRLHSVSEIEIQQLLDTSVKLSRVVVTENLHIVLPDYQNMEIKMEPLPLTVFLFYLRHPEGVPFKRLVDYRDEILHIYMLVTHRSDPEACQKSINALCTPMNNSINEKCARVREAFIGRFSDRVACNYYITGMRGEARTITLDRSLVEWQNQDLKPDASD